MIREEGNQLLVEQGGSSQYKTVAFVRALSAISCLHLRDGLIAVSLRRLCTSNAGCGVFVGRVPTQAVDLGCGGVEGGVVCLCGVMH